MGKATQFVAFTTAGKRVWTNCEESKELATLTSMCSAVVGLAEQFEERIRSAQIGATKVVVVQRHELVFVAAGRGCEAYLARELEYAYDVMVMALTANVHKVLATNAGYDVGELLGSTGTVLASVAEKSHAGGEWLCGAVKGIRLDPTVRAQVGHVLASARVITAKQLGASLVFGFLFCGDRVVQVIAPQANGDRSLRSTDVLLLANFVASQRSSLAAAESSWLPICLPRFENRGYLHAYVSYLDDAIDVSLVLVAADQESQTVAAFRGVSNSVKDALSRDGVLAALRDVAQSNATAFAANRIAAETSSGCDHFLFSRRRALSSSSGSGGGVSTAAGVPPVPPGPPSSTPTLSSTNSSSALAKAKNVFSGGATSEKPQQPQQPPPQAQQKERRSLPRPSSRGHLLEVDLPPAAKPEDALTQCVATDPIDDNVIDDRTWLVYRDLALRLRWNTAQPHATLPPRGTTAHDLFETPLPNALIYEIDGSRTYVALTGPNFELFATFHTFHPITTVADDAKRLLAMIQKEEPSFFFDPIFFNPAA